MSVFVYSVALFIIGGIIAVSFHGVVGVVMVVAGLGGMLLSLLQLVESDAPGIRQDDIDRQIDDLMKHHPR